MTTKAVSAMLRIVTADDSMLIVDRVKRILSEIEEVEFVANASTVPLALELINRTTPDVVILDINFGTHDGQNGIYLLSVVRKVYSKMKIIMLTNFSDMRYRDQCKAYGADYFLDKSNDFDKIPEIIKQILQTKQPTG
jgi:DNA-binding NarL/FixJ family response regulator